MEASKKRKVQKKLFSVIYGRTAVILLLILLQILVMFFGIYFLTDNWTYLYGVFSIMGTIAVVYIINSEENPAFKLTWVLCIMALPIFGTFFYIFVKSQIGTRYIGKRLNTIKTDTEKYMQQDMEIIYSMEKSKLANKNICYYLGKHLGFPTYGNTRLEYYPLGEDKFEALKRELKKAKHFIFMEYFIVEGGEMWNEIRHILEERVAEGGSPVYV